MINVALASTDRKFIRELRLQLVGWGYRPWMADPEESFFEQVQEARCRPNYFRFHRRHLRPDLDGAHRSRATAN